MHDSALALQPCLKRVMLECQLPENTLICRPEDWTAIQHVLRRRELGSRC